jgi:phenylacetate-coenzyme A ligase PaaK-like adenylate-forming protein
MTAAAETAAATKTAATATSATDLVGAETMLDAMRADLPQLDLGLDEWTRWMMRWHFSEATGASFWLEYRDALGFDPLSDVETYADLRKFGPFDKARLRRAAVRDLLPRGYVGRPFRVFETGGTSGAPCRIVNVTRLDNDVLMYAAMLRARGIAGLDIVAMTPSGPHAYGHFVEGLADSWQGAVCAIDFDPRWVKEELRTGGDPDGYLAHLLRQTRTLLELRESGLLFTTTKLLLALAAQLEEPLGSYGIRGVCTGGTSGTPEEERFLRREFLDGVQWIDTYGNTLVGHALQADPLTEDAPRAYHLAPPFGVLRVADPADWTADAPVGARGRVVTTTLLEDLFIPNLIERDGAVRTPPHPWFPWDGVAQVSPLAAPDATEIVEGVY